MVEAILAGWTDQALMPEKLERPLPASWAEQRNHLGWWRGEGSRRFCRVQALPCPTPSGAAVGRTSSSASKAFLVIDSILFRPWIHRRDVYDRDLDLRCVRAFRRNRSRDGPKVTDNLLEC